MVHPRRTGTSGLALLGSQVPLLKRRPSGLAHLLAVRTATAIESAHFPFSGERCTEKELFPSVAARGQGSSYQPTRRPTRALHIHIRYEKDAFAPL
jgi:hypothetical protein